MGEALLFAKVRACFGEMEIFHKKYLKNGKKFVILFMGEYFPVVMCLLYIKCKRLAVCILPERRWA